MDLDDPKLTYQLESIDIELCGQLFNLRHRQTGETRQVDVRFHIAENQWPLEGMVNDLLREIVEQDDPPAKVVRDITRQASLLRLDEDAEAAQHHLQTGQGGNGADESDF